MEQIDKIFTADVTHAALTFSYSSVGTLAYLSLAKEDDSVIYYAYMNDSVKSQSSKYHVEVFTFNPDYIISADVYVKDNLKGLTATSAFELNEPHLYPAPSPCLRRRLPGSSPNPQSPHDQFCPYPCSPSAAAEFKTGA